MALWRGRGRSSVWPQSPRRLDGERFSGPQHRRMNSVTAKHRRLAYHVSRRHSRGGLDGGLESREPCQPLFGDIIRTVVYDTVNKLPYDCKGNLVEHV